MPSATPKPESWVRVTPQGLYVEPGRFFIDPTRPVERAIITHGHADHARPGNTHVLATPGTIAIMQARYGDGVGATQALDYGEPIEVDGVRLWLAPAGHVLGRAQAIVEWHGCRRFRRLQAPLRPDLRPVRGGDLRCLRHRGDVRPAGLPASARR
jgi:putative mRNA 3-end processing factor